MYVNNHMNDHMKSNGKFILLLLEHTLEMASQILGLGVRIVTRSSEKTTKTLTEGRINDQSCLFLSINYHSRFVKTREEALYPLPTRNIKYSVFLIK